MPGERVTISGADPIEGWQRERDGSWSAAVAGQPRTVLRDGEAWDDFNYDSGAGRILVKAGGDPRLHAFETLVRAQGIDLAGKPAVDFPKPEGPSSATNSCSPTSSETSSSARTGRPRAGRYMCRTLSMTICVMAPRGPPVARDFQTSSSSPNAPAFP